MTILLIIALVFGALSFIILRNLWLSIVVFALNFAALWIFMSTIKYGFYDILAFILVNGLFLLFIRLTKDKVSKVDVVISIIGIFGITVLPVITSWSAFHATEYRNLVGDIDIGTFSEDTSPINVKNIRRVDHDLAVNLAEKLLGTNLGLGSRVEVGEMSIQSVNGKQYWVGPLNHSSFLRWFNHKEGTPGYVMVSASNENDVQLVQEVNGKKLHIKYNMGAFFWKLSC